MSQNKDRLLDCIRQFSLGFLKTGSPIYERFGTGSSTCVDISLCSISLLDRYLWERSAFLCSSNYYPFPYVPVLFHRHTSNGGTIEPTKPLHKMVLEVFFDLKKAYDSIWRMGLLLKLYSLELRGRLPLFLRSLMSNRSFQVKCNSFLSSPFLMEEGVLQGSLLSVVLFVLGFNDVVSAISSPIHCSLYVDDLAIYITGPNFPT